jgi:hypothetical protein
MTEEGAGKAPRADSVGNQSRQSVPRTKESVQHAAGRHPCSCSVIVLPSLLFLHCAPSSSSRDASVAGMHSMHALLSTARRPVYTSEVGRTKRTMGAAFPFTPPPPTCASSTHTQAKRLPVPVPRLRLPAAQKARPPRGKASPANQRTHSRADQRSAGARTHTTQHGGKIAGCARVCGRVISPHCDLTDLPAFCHQ